MLSQFMDEVLGKDKLKASFRRVAGDIFGLKASVNEWIIFLDGGQRQLKQRIAELEKRIEQLEMARLSELRNL